MQNGPHRDKPYILATGEQAASRLDLLERILVRELITCCPRPGCAQACVWQRSAVASATQHDGCQRRSDPADAWRAWTPVLSNCRSRKKARQRPAPQMFHSAKAMLTKLVCRGIPLILFTLGSSCAISLILPRHWGK